MGIALENFIRDIPDFPKPGIIFKDITPLLSDPTALKTTVQRLADFFAETKATKILGAEARGFIFGAAVACVLDIGFVPVRKPGKLPALAHSVTYDLEYGTDTLCMHKDAIDTDEEVIIIDDLLATGGTVEAMIQLVSKAGGRVSGAGFVIELGFLNARELLDNCCVKSLIRYD